MQFDNPFCDSQSEPRTALFFRVGTVDLVELVENASLLFPRDAGPGVSDRYLKHTIGHSGGNAHFALVCELDGVADEVEEHLGDAPLVAATDRHAFFHRYLER